MSTTTEASDPIDFVRAVLAPMSPKQLIRIAADTDLSPRTLDNIRKGRDANYSTVMKLHELLKQHAAKAAPAKRAKK